MALVYSDELYHYGIKGQKWGVRRFQNPDGSLTPAGVVRYRKHDTARSVYTKAVRQEPRITANVISAAKNSGVKLYGLNHRLKTKASIQRKIGKKMEEDGLSLTESANSINDAVRYTTISSNKSFVDNYYKFKNEMKSAGYEEIKCKNYFMLYKQGKVKHKSVQCLFKSPNGYIFEIQFQTPESQKAKDLKVPIYEERRQVGISNERAKELEGMMVELAEKVPYPNGIQKIKSF